jgi:hypothetical protein
MLPTPVEACVVLPITDSIPYGKPSRCTMRPRARYDVRVRFSHFLRVSLQMATSSRSKASPVTSRLCVLLLCASIAPLAAAADPEEARKPIAGVATNCADCGVVRAIRELRTEREVQRPDVYTSSPQYKDTMPAELPRIGPAISLSWGAGERPRTQIGAIGTPEMRHRYIEITYEITVKFDDGRFALIEQDDASDLHPGDRVIVLRKRVQKIDEQ